MTTCISKPTTKEETVTVAKFLTRQIKISGKTQAVIAQEVGFHNPNVITMLKQGRTKVPHDKIGAVAKSLEVDPAYMLRLVIGEYDPGLLCTIEIATGRVVITSQEQTVIDVMRDAAEGEDLAPMTAAESEEFKRLVKKWKSSSLR